MKIGTKINQTVYSSGNEVLKLCFKYIQHHPLVLLVPKGYEWRVGMHNISIEANGIVCPGGNTWYLGRKEFLVREVGISEMLAKDSTDEISGRGWLEEMLMGVDCSCTKLGVAVLKLTAILITQICSFLEDTEVVCGVLLSASTSGNKMMLVVIKKGENITQELLEEICKKANGVFTQKKYAHLRCSFMVIRTGIYKESSGVIDVTMLGKDVFAEGLNHLHKEVGGEIIGKLKHWVFGGDEEIICRNSWQSYAYVEVNWNDRALEIQLEVILFLPGSWNVGYGIWMLYKYLTCINVSTPSSVQYHITRDTQLKLVAVQVLILTTLHGFPIYRLHGKWCIVVHGWFSLELSTKVDAFSQQVIGCSGTFWPIWALQVMLLLVPSGQ